MKSWEMFLALICLGVQCPNVSVSWPRVGALGLGVTLVWQSMSDGWEPFKDILAMKDTVMGARGENRML
jgi:hypothetical protein